MIKFFNPGPGVLQQNPQMMGQPPVLAGATGNARGSNRMPQIPDNRIGLGEAMMRIGGAGLGQSANGGGNAVYGSMLNQYGQIQDYNRQDDMERMKIERYTFHCPHCGHKGNCEIQKD